MSYILDCEMESTSFPPLSNSCDDLAQFLLEVQNDPSLTMPSSEEGGAPSEESVTIKRHALSLLAALSWERSQVKELVRVAMVMLEKGMPLPRDAPVMKRLQECQPGTSLTAVTNCTEKMCQESVAVPLDDPWDPP